MGKSCNSKIKKYFNVGNNGYSDAKTIILDDMKQTLMSMSKMQLEKPENYNQVVLKAFDQLGGSSFEVLMEKASNAFAKNATEDEAKRKVFKELFLEMSGNMLLLFIVDMTKLLEYEAKIKFLKKHNEQIDAVKLQAEIIAEFAFSNIVDIVNGDKSMNAIATKNLEDMIDGDIENLLTTRAGKMELSDYELKEQTKNELKKIADCNMKDMMSDDDEGTPWAGIAIIILFIVIFVGIMIVQIKYGLPYGSSPYYYDDPRRRGNNSLVLNF